MGGESPVPARLLPDLLVAVFVPVEAFLREFVSAEETATAACNERPNNTIADLQGGTGSICSWGVDSKLKDLTDDFMPEDCGCMGGSTSANGVKVAAADCAC
jgi:hypothetical protein